MLQQTTVATVIDYYKKFTEKFPDIQTLAAAEEDEVLKLWQGLGYYSRAKNLRKGAQVLMKSFGGIFPRSREELLQIPGIGPYTAGAISSIALGIPQAALDGNLIRVYSRFFGIKKPVDDVSTLKELWKIAHNLVPSDISILRDFTEGMMELGATVCLPRNAVCSACPLKKNCKAFKMSLVESLPIKAKKSERTKLRERIYFLRKGRNIAIMERGADPKFPHFWRLPYEAVNEGLKDYHLKMKYSVTTRDFEVFVDIESRPPKKMKLTYVSEKKLSEMLLPTIDRKIFQKLAKYSQAN